MCYIFRMSNEEWLSATEVARRLPFASANQVRAWAEGGLIEGALRYPPRPGARASRRWMIPWSGVEKMLELSNPTALRPHVEQFLAMAEASS